MKTFLIKKFSSLRTARFQEDGYDLDLTYVTDRIIAMSFPGSGYELLYRNSGSDVAKLLDKRHGKHYKIYNLSGATYDYKKFNYQVAEFPWDDHHSPPLSLLFEACQSIHNYLQADPQNVIAVHCHAGKGRTGTIIVCYMLFCGRFATADEALEYYRRKRFLVKGGVTQPSQLRAIRYFEKTFNLYQSLNKYMEPVVVQTESITISGIPNFGGSFSPAFKIYSVKEKTLLYSSIHFVKPMQYNVKDFSKIEFNFGSKSPKLVGDVMFKVYHENKIGSLKTVLRFAINTSFLDIDPSGSRANLKLTLETLDPYELRKDKKIPLNLTVEVVFKVFNKEDRHMLETPGNQGALVAKECQKLAEKDEEDWAVIYEILGKFKSPSKEESTTLLFKSKETDDVDSVLKNPEAKEEIEQDYELIGNITD